MPHPDQDNCSVRIPDDALFSVLLEHPDFSHFQEVGNDDFRDPLEKNASFSLSSKGYRDYKNGNKGNLFYLVEKRNLVNKARERAGLSVTTQRSVHQKIDKNQLAGELWNQAKATTEDARHICDYLTEHRNIPSENYQDLIDSALLRWSPGHKEYPPALAYPFHFIEDDGSVRDKVQKIHFIRKEPYKGKRKNALGSDGHLTILPPLVSASQIGYLAMEGLEDALSIRNKYPNKTIVVASSKENFKHLERLLNTGDELLLIADNDGEENLNGGQVIAAKVCQVLRKKGVDAKAIMPPAPKDDANQARQENKLDLWLNSLVEVPPAPLIQTIDFDVESVKGEQIPTLPKGILPAELEEYLGLAAQSLDLNYEAAFCEFLVNASVAVGGHKQIVIRPDWLEKSIIWLASIGKSGVGKSPLAGKCGGDNLQSQQREWYLQFKQEKKFWENSDEGKGDKPIRRRWIATGLTIERLCALHEENPPGIGITSDEIMGVLDGLNQYKGKGNDKQKLLSLWNGKSFENPTAESDRYIPSVFVPISGGIQEDLVRKIINDSNTTDGLAGRFLFNHLLLEQRPRTPEEQEQIDDLIAQSKGKDILSGVFHKLASIRDKENQVTMNHYAKDLLAALEYQLKVELRKGSDQAAAAYAKLRTYIYRIALLIHYVSERKPDEVELSEATANHTIQVMFFFIANMKRAYGSVELTDKERKARAILDKLHQLGGEAAIRDIKQLLKKSIKADEVEAISKMLEEAGELLRTPKGKTFVLSLPKNGSQVLT